MPVAGRRGSAGRGIKQLRVPENLTELAYRAIRESILSGDITLEDRLSEERLATQLGISKSPIREAINRLGVEGLVEISPRRGTRVTHYDPSSVAQLFEVREALETLAIRLLRAPADLVAELRGLTERCEAYVRDRDLKRFTIEDIRFHGLLVEATGNRFLLRTFRNLQDHVQLVRVKSIHLPGRPDRSQREHRRIVAALVKGAVAEAEELLREHIRAVKEDVVRHLSEQIRVAAAGSSDR